MSLPDETTKPPWWEGATKPTNAELVEWLSVTSDANRDWWLDRIQQNAEDAARCFEQGHDSLRSQLENAWSALRQAYTRIEWLERNYRRAEETA